MEEVPDPRADEEAADPEVSDLERFPSVQALKEAVEILKECKCRGFKGILMMMDKNSKVYLCASEQNIVLPKHTCLGGVGSGRTLTGDEAEGGIPFILPKGDKTLIVLSSQGSEDDEEAQEHTKPRESDKVLTFYKAVKSMSAEHATDLQLAGHGKVQPKNEGPGKHGYAFEYPAGHVKHVPMSYVEKSGEKKEPKVTYGNFFKGCKSFSGSLGMVWKIVHKTVHKKLMPDKPIIVLLNEMELKKGQPVMVAICSK